MAQLEFEPNNRFVPSTSLSEENDKKQIDPVAKGTVSNKKTFADNFSRNIKAVEKIDIKEEIVDDVVIPGFKNFVSNMLESIISAFGTIASDVCDIIIWGEKQNRSEKARRGVKRSYDSYYDSSKGSRVANKIREQQKLTALDYDIIEFDTRYEAKEVLDKMKELLEEYELCSVADYYSAASLEHNFTDEKYGWTNLSNASITRRRNGKYAILLPKARIID